MPGGCGNWAFPPAACRPIWPPAGCGACRRDWTRRERPDRRPKQKERATMTGLKPWLDRCPLVAILRGLTPDEAPAIGDVLVEAGFVLLEVPLNSPEPTRSIEILARRLGDRALIGAGTVMTAVQVDAVAAAGGR